MNALTPNLPSFIGEVSGRTISADIATSVSPTKLPVRKPRSVLSPPSSRLQVRRQRPIRVFAQHTAFQHGLSDDAEIAAPFE